MNSHKLSKYTKKKCFEPSRLPLTVAKIVHKVLQGEFVAQDVWKVGVDCLQTGGIKKIVKDGDRTAEEYIMEYDSVAIEKAEQRRARKELEENFKQRTSLQNFQSRTPSHVPRTTINNLAVICEDQEELQNSDEVQIERARAKPKTLTEIQQENRRKAEKLGIEKICLVKSTNYSFFMTCNLGLGINARLGMEKELRNKKKTVKSLGSVVFGSSNAKRANLIKKLEIYKGLENFSGVSSNIFQNCINGSKFSDKYYESLSVGEREKLAELIDSFKKKAAKAESPNRDMEFSFDPADINTPPQKEFQNFGRTIFGTSDLEESRPNTIKVYPQNILFQNIDSYLGGERDFWERASQKSHILSGSKS